MSQEHAKVKQDYPETLYFVKRKEFGESLLFFSCSSTASVGRKQFMSFDSAQTASAILGCEGEELHTAVFKHHLRQLLQRATGGVRERRAADEPEEGQNTDCPC